MKKETIRIVPIELKHASAYRKAVDQVAREGKYLRILKAFSLAGTQRFILNNLKNKNAHYVALDGVRVVGWCDIVRFEHPTERHLGGLGMAVVAEYRGRGIGAELMRVCLDHAKAQGLEWVYLDVYVSNRPAIRLYRKFGFKRDGVRPKARKYKGRYEDILLMSKRLR